MFTELSAWDLWAVLSKFFAYLSCLLAVGTTLFMLANGDLIKDQRKTLLKLIIVAVLAGATASLVQFGVQAGRLLDEGIAGMLDPEMLDLVKDAPLGTSVFIRIVGLLLMMIAIFQHPVTYWIAGAGALVTAASFSFVGHGTGEPRWVLTTLVTLHVLGISFWIGALLPIRRAVSKDSDLVSGGELAHRFGQQAQWIVGGLVVAGAVLAILIAGSPLSLVTTQYGMTLIIKLVIVSLLLALAAANKLRFVPAIRQGDASAAHHLRQAVSLEMIAVAVILLVTAILTTITPLPEAMEITNG